MPKFSERSKMRLDSCNIVLQNLFTEVVRDFDCTILAGHRGKALQNRLFEDGKTKLKYPDSKHNKYPSMAIDVAPWPIDWEDRERFTYFGGFVLGSASRLGIKIRWGGDWDMDTQVKDNVFDDLVHFEIIT